MTSKAALQAREYRKNFPDKVKESQLKWKQNNYFKASLINIRNRAKRKGMEFNIELSDVVCPEYCPSLGIKLTQSHGQGSLDSNASIDRIDSNKGYIKGNIQVISCLANQMKSAATEEQLVTFATNILSLHK